jgi:hypothetical protein
VLPSLLSGGRERRHRCGGKSWHHDESTTRFGESWQPQPMTGDGGPNSSLLSGGSEQRSRCGGLVAEEGATATLGHGRGREEREARSYGGGVGEQHGAAGV